MHRSEPSNPAERDDVAIALHAIDRRGFLPSAARPYADQDRPLAIGRGQTNSQPSTVATMLRLLAVPTGARVMDVGAGSGWTTALLARLVGPDGEVLGVERDAGLAAWGASNLATTGMTWARIIVATPGVLGSPRAQGWDRILVSATASTLPRALVEQLSVPGRLVMPVGHVMTLVENRSDGVAISAHGTYSFVPLVED